MPKTILYVDTCVVIQATQSRCWNALAGHYDIRTVVEVARELATKPDALHGYIEIDMDAFRAQVIIEQPSTEAQMKAASKSATLLGLDAGERDLLAHVFAIESSAWLVTTGDKAAVLAACAMGLADRLISLEEATEQCGQKPKLKDCYSKRWLTAQKTSYLFETL